MEARAIAKYVRMSPTKVGVVLEGKSKTLKNEFDAAKAEYDLFLSEVEEKKQLLAEAIASGDQAAIELYQQQYDDALAKADEAQEEYLSKAEEYAESLRAILENSLNEYAQTWQHLDETGNLLLNFKTINRENNPKQGQNQGNNFNIPRKQRLSYVYDSSVARKWGRSI